MRLAVVLVCAMLAGGCATSLSEMQERNEKIAETNLRLGMGYAQQGKLEDALEKLKKAEDVRPDYAAVHGALALVYERLQEYDEADDHYREAIDLQPQDGGVYNNYGVFLCRRGEFTKADEYFNKALDQPRYKTPERAYENAGACAKQIPDLNKAETYLRKALTINPKLPLALYEMADIMYQKDNYLSARGYLQRYEEVSRHTAESLWLGIKVESQLGDEKAKDRYAKLLQSQYPDSLEYKKWLDDEP
jgi:type IV pilus assembly protein PilF